MRRYDGYSLHFYTGKICDHLRQISLFPNYSHLLRGLNVSPALRLIHPFPIWSRAFEWNKSGAAGQSRTTHTVL
jgi:hypothetical protein